MTEQQAFEMIAMLQKQIDDAYKYMSFTAIVLMIIVFLLVIKVVQDI